MRKNKRIIGLLGVGAILLTSMTGCVLPDEERYRSIDRTLEELDYTTIGDSFEVIVGSGSGVIGPSYKTVNYTGKKAFQEAKDRVVDLDESCEVYRTANNFYCSYSNTPIRITENDGITEMIIEDPQSGRA